jgi:hypothetical protein
MKRMSLLTLLITAGIAVYAQNSTSGNVPIGAMSPQTPQLRTPMEVKTRFGLKGGVNVAKLSAKEFTATAEPSTNNKTSYHAGAFVNIPIGGLFKLQPELIYSSQGSKMQETVTSTGGSRTYNYEEDLNYLNLPVMLQLQTSGGFVVETGPQFSYLLDARQKGETPISTTDKTDIKDYRDKFELAWGLGVGYLTRIGVGIGARYNYGIRNIVEENDVSIGELRNRVLQFSLSYQFGASK